MSERAKKEEPREKAQRWLPDDVHEHLKAARTEMRESYRALFPPAFIEHRRIARREMLLAARSLIDHLIQRLEQAPKP